ncbi:MAG: hypothetical protein ACTHMV_00010 [Chitinophagaceae bacterium]
MRVVRIIFLVLGILLILFNILGYVAGARPFPDDPNENTAHKIAYFIGSNLFLIVGGIFLLVARNLQKKMNKKNDKQLIDSLFTDQDPDK